MQIYNFITREIEIFVICLFEYFLIQMFWWLIHFVQNVLLLFLLKLNIYTEIKIIWIEATPSWVWVASPHSKYDEAKKGEHWSFHLTQCSIFNYLLCVCVYSPVQVGATPIHFKF